MFNCDHCNDTGTRLEDHPIFYYETPCDCAAGDRVARRGHFWAVVVLLGAMALMSGTLGAIVLIHRLVFG